MKNRSIGIIGGGASGMMAAIAAAKEGAKVTIFEKKDTLGKKILATGNGRCNFSNLNMSHEYYYTDDELFIKDAFTIFGVDELIEFFNSLGVLVKEKNGYLYPLSEQAVTILDSFKIAIKNLGIDVLLNSEIKNVVKTDDVFEVSTDLSTYKFDKLIISSGGRSGLLPKEYCNSYDLIKQFGISYSRLYPALTQLKCSGLDFKKLSGVRSDAKLSVYIDDELTMEQFGEVLINDLGLSGIVTFQISHLAVESVSLGKSVDVLIDFLPGISEDELLTLCKTKMLLHPEYTLQEFFSGFLNTKLNEEIIKTANIDNFDTKVSDMDSANLLDACLLMKKILVHVTGGADFNKSQVTGGGVMLSEMKPSFEYNFVPGLYITGELLNVDGLCGGYNLQWAFTSGYIAGKCAATE